MDVIMGALNWYAALPSSVMVMIGIFLVGLLLARLKDSGARKSVWRRHKAALSI